MAKSKLSFVPENGLVNLLLVVLIVVLLFIFVKPSIARMVCQHKVDELNRPDRSESLKKELLKNNNTLSNLARQIESLKTEEKVNFQDCLHRWGE